MSDRKSFVLYKSWGPMITSMPAEQAGVLMQAVFSFQAGEDPEIEDPLVASIFAMIRATMIEDDEKYRSECRKRAKAGRAGAEKTNVKPASADSEAAKAASADCKPAKPASAGIRAAKPASADSEAAKPASADSEAAKPADNESESDSDIESESDNESESVSESEKHKEREREKADSANPPRAPKAKAEARHKHGKYGHVLLTDGQLDELIFKHGREPTEAAVQCVDDYCEQSGKKYKNYALALEKWGYASAAEQAAKASGPGKHSTGSAYMDAIRDRVSVVDDWLRQTEGKDNDKNGIC